MGRTIELSDIKILNWTLDVDARNVTINYQIRDAADEIYVGGQAVFWETMPDPGEDLFGDPGTLPDNWFQLPPSHSQALTDITIDARSGLLHLLD